MNTNIPPPPWMDDGSDKLLSIYRTKSQSSRTSIVPNSHIKPSSNKEELQENIKKLVTTQYFIERCLFSTESPDIIRRHGIVYNLSKPIDYIFYDLSFKIPDWENVKQYIVRFSMIFSSDSEDEDWDIDTNILELTIWYKNFDHKAYSLSRDDAYYVIGCSHFHRINPMTIEHKLLIDDEEVYLFADGFF